jgi:branched-chain amino acid transport system ATP-binding protein
MGEPLLTTEKLSNHFGMVCTALDLDLRFEPGVLTSIIGPNGAGKSTLINLLTGHLPVQAGKIRFQGRDITRLPIHKRVRMGICRSFQVVNVFPELTVAQNVMIPVLARTGRAWNPIRSLSRETAVLRETEAILTKVALLAERDTPATALSHGDLRLLEVGVALAAAPTLLFLDEPTAGMNPVERVRLLENIRQLAREGRTTFVVVEHDMDVVFSLSERIIVLHRGEILCDGTPGQVRADAKVREVYLGDDVSDLFRYGEE